MTCSRKLVRIMLLLSRAVGHPYTPRASTRIMLLLQMFLEPQREILSAVRKTSWLLVLLRRQEHQGQRLQRLDRARHSQIKRLLRCVMQEYTRRTVPIILPPDAMTYL